MNAITSLKQIFQTVPLATAALCGLQAHAATESASQKGLHYAQQWRLSDAGYQDSSAAIRMTLIEKGGASSDRFMRMASLETSSAEKNIGDKVLLSFEAPANIKGSKVLIHSMVREGDQVWLYLPALKRVKRVAAADRSGSFSGSEFSYEDIGSMEVGNYDYEWLRTERCGEAECAVVKQVPLYPYSGYSHIVVWYNVKDFRQMKIDYFDRKEALFKTLTLTDYQLFLGNYWRALTMNMANHITGKKSVLKSSDVRFRTGAKQASFDPSALDNLAP